MPAASRTRAVNNVVEFAGTETLALKAPPVVTVATAVPPHSGWAKMLTVAFAPALLVPARTGVVDVRDGDAGVEPVMTGASGTWVLWVYEIPAEHGDTLPAGSVAVAYQVVVAFAVAWTWAVNSPVNAVVVATTLPPQFAWA